jgi:hypothetical protein
MKVWIWVILEILYLWRAPKSNLCPILVPNCLTSMDAPPHHRYRLHPRTILAIQRSKDCHPLHPLQSLFTLRYLSNAFSFVSSKLREDMIDRQMNGQKKGGLKSKTLWGKWGSTKTTIRTIFAGMPDKHHKMKSGMQIYNAHQKLVRDHYRATFVSS